MTSLAELFHLIYITVYDIIGRVPPIDYVTLYDIGKAFPIYLCDVVWHYWQSLFHWYTWRCMTSLAELFPLIYVTLYDIGRTFPIAFCDVVSHHWQSFSHLFMWHCMTSLAELFPFIYMWHCVTSVAELFAFICVTLYLINGKTFLPVDLCDVVRHPAWVPVFCALPCGTNVLNIMLLFAKSPFQILLLEFQYVVHDRVEQLS